MGYKVNGYELVSNLVDGKINSFLYKEGKAEEFARCLDKTRAKLNKGYYDKTHVIRYIEDDDGSPYGFMEMDLS